MSNIHPSAIVSPKAKLGSNVSVGPYAIIEDDVQIGDSSRIDSSAVIADGARIGKSVQISHGAVIATEPQDLKFGGEDTLAEIGENTIIREFATINRGTIAHGKTTLGKNCLVMAYAHVAHDCIIGDHVILANSVNLAGHVEIGDYAILGGVLPVHQFVKIGAHAMVGGGFRVQQDICPFSLVGGYPLKVVGINSVGLKRRGFSQETVKTLEQVFKILFFSELNTTQAAERIKSEFDSTPEIKEILGFINRSNRGIVK
ncbi:MAG: acyl-ACP--UDP-N-acetylglucosamine O-acyltransferase [Candidatus Zixiibacteriota bacterium]